MLFRSRCSSRLTLFFLLVQQRLATNVPRTLDNTREYDPNSYLTANPESLASLAARRKIVRQEAPAEDSEEDDEEEGSEAEDEEPQAGPSRLQGRKSRGDEDEEMDDRFQMDEDMPDAEAGDEDAEAEAEAEAEGDEENADEQPEAPPQYMAPPRILLTTSPSPTKATYEFLAELRSVFPGAEVRKRLKGKGYEMGRIARWAAKREYAAMVVVNEDHKRPSECYRGCF